MAARKRCLLYSQHVLGAGHFVRTYEIGRALAVLHDVFLVDGSRPMPRAGSADIALVPIPRLKRIGLEIVPFESDCRIEEVLQRRKQCLLDAIDQIRPDLLMVEHFPFSKWPLYDEVISSGRRVRALNARAKVVCSVRDMVLRAHPDMLRERYSEEVLETLNEHFDLLLAHADPRFARLEEELPWLDQLQIPLQYTGYVSESIPVSPRPRGTNENHGGRASVVVSTGSTGGTAVLRSAIDAWKILQSQPSAQQRRLTLFASLSTTPAELQDLERQGGEDSIRVLPFSTDFLSCLPGADLSISNAGYNTCMNILQARLRSILIPTLHLADQSRRAQRFADRGLSCTIPAADLTPQRLADAIAERLNVPAPVHNIDLDGASTTRNILESLLEDGQATAPPLRFDRPTAPLLEPRRRPSEPVPGRPDRRFLLYSQHMAGTGHFVRTSEIAKALSNDGEVYLVDGGRPVPRELSSSRITLIPLPRIRRDGHRVVPMDPDQWTGDVMGQRSRLLLSAVQQVRCDVLLIEHFPFRRWEVCAEVLQVIASARAINPHVKVVCSLRDIPGRSAFEPCIDRYATDVRRVLHEHFDHVLVHADPRLVRLDEQLSWVSKINIPLEYTGYVSQRCPNFVHAGGAHGESAAFAEVVVSAGGTGSTMLLSQAIEAWKLLATQRAVGDRTMAVFLPLSARSDELATLRQQAAGQRIQVLPYTTDFLDWMQHAELSISNAGYNTCTNVLEARVRSILIPNRQMSDQPLRCQRFAQLGLSRTLEEAGLTAEHLAEAIVERLNTPAPQHDFQLDGAEFTRSCLEHLLGSTRIHQFRIPGQLADSLGRTPGLRAG